MLGSKYNKVICMLEEFTAPVGREKSFGISHSKNYDLYSFENDTVRSIVISIIYCHNTSATAPQLIS